MFNLYDLLTFALLLAAVAYWWHISARKTIALRIARNHCHQRGLQLLDQTLVFRKYRLARDSRQRLHLCRVYEFDFCTDGTDRYKGELHLAGRHAIRIIMESTYREISEGRCETGGDQDQGVNSDQ